MTMDPWQSAGTDEREERSTLKFEDNFEPSYRLPDSVEYLASLGNMFQHASFIIVNIHKII